MADEREARDLGSAVKRMQKKNSFFELARHVVIRMMDAMNSPDEYVLLTQGAEWQLIKDKNGCHTFAANPEMLKDETPMNSTLRSALVFSYWDLTQPSSCRKGHRI